MTITKLKRYKNTELKDVFNKKIKKFRKIMKVDHYLYSRRVFSPLEGDHRWMIQISGPLLPNS